MRRRDVLINGLITGAWVYAAPSWASRARPLVCFLGSAASTSPFYQGFNEGLSKLGYIDRQNVDITRRFAEGDLSQLPPLAEELIRLVPDVLVASVTAAGAAAKRLTGTVPIVVPQLIAPVDLGLAETLARPGGNLTGILGSIPGLIGKQLDILREIAPNADRIGIVHNPANPQNLIQMEEAKRILGSQAVPIPVKTPENLQSVFDQIPEERITGLLVLPDPVLFTARRRVGELAIRARIPIMYSLREHPEEEGLVSYSINRRENYRRAAYFVHMILNGKRPAELPIELPSSLELVVNVRAAKKIGIKLSESFLARADEVIE